MARNLDERGEPVDATHGADRQEFSAEEAKQGRRGTAVLAVLLGGLVLAFLVWGAVEIWGESTDVDRTADTEEVQPPPSQEQTGAVDQSAPTPATPAPVDRDPTAQTGTGGESQQVSPDGTQQ